MRDTCPIRYATKRHFKGYEYKTLPLVFLCLENRVNIRLQRLYCVTINFIIQKGRMQQVLSPSLLPNKHSQAFLDCLLILLLLLQAI